VGASCQLSDAIAVAFAAKASWAYVLSSAAA
jgi:hypothetical protein